MEAFIPQAEAEQPLLQQIDRGMLDRLGITMVRETRGKPFDKPKAFFNLPQQNPAAVRRDPPAVKPGHNFPPADRVKFKRPLRTLCFHGTVSLVKRKWVSSPSLTSGETVSFHPRCEKCGLTLFSCAAGYARVLCR